MSWTDRIAVQNIMRLKRDFGIKDAVETGTFRGVNAELYSLLFRYVDTCEINNDYLSVIAARLYKYKNVHIHIADSAKFLSRIWFDYPTFVYLDAHFYDPKSLVKWVVIEELKALKYHNDIVLCIHDFDNDMGHLIYDDEHLNWNLVGKYLREVNPGFSYYVNTECDPYTEETIKHLPITIDDDVLDSIKFVHSTPQREQRGMLFCTPKSLDLTDYKLREFQP